MYSNKLKVVLFFNTISHLFLRFLKVEI